MVSVIIPTHYRADRLVRAIESVQDQTYKDIEIFVISDGYDKETNDVVMEKMKCDSRINYLVNEGKHGANVVRNIGIENCRGDYVAFLDDDDIWYPTKLEKQLQIFEQNSKLGLVGCAIRVVYVEKNTSYNTIFKDVGDLSQKILFGNCIGSTSCVVIRKEVIKKCGMFDETLPARQDYDYWIRICQEYEVDFVKEVQLDYYVYPSEVKSAQISSSFDKYFKAYKIMNVKYEKLYLSCDVKMQRRIKAQGYRNLSVRARDNKKITIAFKYWMMSLKWGLSQDTLKCLIMLIIPKDILLWIRSKI